jgi:hypothetical protein
MLTMEACRLNMELWRVYRPVVQDSHHFDEVQDPILTEVKSWIQIRIPGQKIKKLRARRR